MINQPQAWHGTVRLTASTLVAPLAHEDTLHWPVCLHPKAFESRAGMLASINSPCRATMRFHHAVASGPLVVTSCISPHRFRSCSRSTSSAVLVRASGGDKGRPWWQSLADFDSWAPRSAHFWRPNPKELQSSGFQSDVEGGSGPGTSSEEASTTDARKAGASPDLDSVVAELPPQGSFSDVDDSDLASALSLRVRQMQGEPPVPPLTAEEIKTLLNRKYGKSYDITLVRRDIPGKTLVALNVMWLHLEQRSFKLTEDEYMEKLDSIAYLLNTADQAHVVRTFLSAPAKSQNGMPSRPVVGTAVTIPLNVSQSTVEAWFGRS